MKYILYLILKNTSKSYHVLEQIKSHGYNATLVSTESLRHAIDEFPEEKSFFTLRNYETQKFQESILCMFIEPEEKLEELKQIIRLYTNCFCDIKGGMFSKKLEDYEGTI